MGIPKRSGTCSACYLTSGYTRANTFDVLAIYIVSFLFYTYVISQFACEVQAHCKFFAKFLQTRKLITQEVTAVIDRGSPLHFHSEWHDPVP